MAVYSRSIVAGTSLVLHAFPLEQSLADWLTYRATGTEGSSPNEGKYTFSLDSDNSTIWEIFAGSGQPANWNQSIGNISLALPNASPDSAGGLVITENGNLNIDGNLTYISGAVTVALQSGNLVDAVTTSLTAYSVSTLTATEVRQEMDANSVQLVYISGNAGGGGASAASIRAEMDANSVMFNYISGNIGGTALSSGQTADAVTTALTSYSVSTLTAAQARSEMDANSVQLAYISGNSGGGGATASAIRAEMDANSVQLAYISGNIGGTALSSGQTVDAVEAALAAYDVSTATVLTSVQTGVTDVQSNLIRKGTAYVWQTDQGTKSTTIG